MSDVPPHHALKTEFHATGAGIISLSSVIVGYRRISSDIAGYRRYRPPLYDAGISCTLSSCYRYIIARRHPYIVHHYRLLLLPVLIDCCCCQPHRPRPSLTPVWDRVFDDVDRGRNQGLPLSPENRNPNLSRKASPAFRVATAAGFAKHPAMGGNGEPSPWPHPIMTGEVTFPPRLSIPSHPPRSAREETALTSLLSSAPLPSL